MDDRGAGSAGRAPQPPARGLPPDLAVSWSAAYQPAWDAAPGAYVEHGVVGWGRSRRLAKVQHASRPIKAYIGVQHFDPARWNTPGEPRAVFFLSLFVANRTVALRTFPTMSDLLAELAEFYNAPLSN